MEEKKPPLSLMVERLRPLELTLVKQGPFFIKGRLRQLRVIVYVELYHCK